MNTCLYANDIDDYACKVYTKNWNDGTLHKEDIRNVTADDICRRGIPDVICGGVPCQDVSLAGKGAGLKEGNRTGLWFEMLRLVSEIRPRYAIVENVPGLINRGLDIILGTLSEIGYNAEWEIISASAFGAPHQRDRVFIVAYPRCELREQGRQKQRSVFGLCEEWDSLRESDRSSEMGIVADSDSQRCVTGRNTERQHENYLPEVRQTSEDQQSRSKRQCRSSQVYEASTNTDDSGREEQRQPESGGECLTASKCDSWWQAESQLCGIPDGLSTGMDRHRRERLKCLGNAIVPQVAQYVGECIMAHNGGEFSFAELFAGIGGFRLGFENARYEA